MKTIYTYTEEQATEDGMLFAIASMKYTDWDKGIFSHITSNLMDQGYIGNPLNIADLLNQANQIVKKASKNFTEHDTFFSGSVELPNGSQQKVFIQQNATGKFTIMLPQDY